MWNIILPRITIFQSQTKVQKQVKMCPQGYSSIFPDLKFSNTSSVYLIRYFVSTYRPDACSTGNIYLTSSLQLHSNVTRCTERESHDFEVICRYTFANLYFSLIELWRPFSAFDRELKWWLNLKEVFLQWQFPWPASAVQWQCRVWGVGFLNVDIGTLMQSLSKLRYWGTL